MADRKNIKNSNNSKSLCITPNSYEVIDETILFQHVAAIIDKS